MRGFGRVDDLAAGLQMSLLTQIEYVTSSFGFNEALILWKKNCPRHIHKISKKNWAGVGGGGGLNLNKDESNELWTFWNTAWWRTFLNGGLGENTFWNDCLTSWICGITSRLEPTSASPPQLWTSRMRRWHWKFTFHQASGRFELRIKMKCHLEKQSNHFSIHAGDIRWIKLQNNNDEHLSLSFMITAILCHVHDFSRPQNYSFFSCGFFVAFKKSWVALYLASLFSCPVLLLSTHHTFLFPSFCHKSIFV